MMKQGEIKVGAIHIRLSKDREILGQMFDSLGSKGLKSQSMGSAAQKRELTVSLANVLSNGGGCSASQTKPSRAEDCRAPRSS